MIEADASTLDNVTKSTLVWFTAEWCGPCKRFKPVAAAFDAEDSGIDLVQVDIDQNRELVDRFNVMSVPTVVALSDTNEEVGRFNGTKSLADLKNFVVEVYGE